MNKITKIIKYSISISIEASGHLPFLYLLLNVIGVTATLFSSFAIKQIIDKLVGENIKIENILILIIVYILSIVVVQIIYSFQNILYDSISKKTEHLYECKVSEKLCDLSLSIIDSTKGRNLIDDVRYAADKIMDITNIIVQVISFAYSLFISLGVLIKFDIFFTLLFLFFAIPGIILKNYFVKRSERLRKEKAPDIRKFCYYRWMLTDPWPAKDVRMYDLTQKIKERYSVEKEKYLVANKELDKKQTKSLMLAEFIRRSGEILFMLFVLHRATMGQISIGDIALYIGLMLSASNSFNGIMINFVIGYTSVLEIMNPVLDFFSINTSRDFIKRELKKFESLEFRNVYFKYPYTDKYILSGVSFTLFCGDKLSIVGINGSGKSTIIKLMLGLYEINSGEILINGYSINEYDIEDVRRIFSVLFQNFVRYPLTLRENISLSLIEDKDNNSKIKAAMMKANVYDELNPKINENYDFFMTRQFVDDGIELSKGQWQKIAVSRAYFKDAAIIIFDEPSAALDAEAEDKIFENFKSISSGRTGIMISHRISSAKISNKIIVLDDGEIIEQGTHDELLLNDGLYAKLYNLQQKKYKSNEENSNE